MASKVRRRAPAAVKGGGKSKTRGGGATSTVAGEESEPPIGTVFGCGLLATSALDFIKFQFSYWTASILTLHTQLDSVTSAHSDGI